LREYFDLRERKWQEAGKNCIMGASLLLCFTIYYQGNQIKDDKIGMPCSTNGRNAYKILVGNREGRRPVRRPRHGWEDNVRIDHKEIEWEGLDWMHLAQDRDQWQALVNTVMSLWVP
jgi:hypothetical protein